MLDYCLCDYCQSRLLSVFKNDGDTKFVLLFKKKYQKKLNNKNQ